MNADALLVIFRRVDKSRRGVLSHAAFGQALTEANLMLAPQELDLLLRKFTDLLAPADVKYGELVRMLKEHPDGTHAVWKRPTSAETRVARVARAQSGRLSPGASARNAVGAGKASGIFNADGTVNSRDPLMAFASTPSTTVPAHSSTDSIGCTQANLALPTMDSKISKGQGWG